MHRIFSLLLLISIGSYAQPYRYVPNGSPINLKGIQKSFSDYKDTVNLKDVKYWKYMNRWEQEMSMHCNGNGEIGSAQELQQYLKNRSEIQNFSRSFSASWFPVGPNYVPENYTGYLENGIGRINCIAFHPTNPDVFYVGVAQGGLWKTSNGGTSWMPLTDQLPITRVSDIAINPNNPDEIYISLCDFEYVGIGLELDNRKRFPHYGLGVYKSLDGGFTWNSTALEFDLVQRDASLIRKIIINPTNTNELVACGVGGVFKSFDAGSSWTTTLDTLSWDLVQHPINPNVLFLATGWINSAQVGYAGIFKSTDFGQTWQELSTGIPTTNEVQRIKIAISESNPSVMYAATVNVSSGLYGIYKSINSGNSWTLHYADLNLLEAFEGTGTGGQGTYDLAFHVDRENPLKVYIGGVNLWMSEDGASTFNPVNHWTTYYGPTIHADMHQMTQNPLTNEYFMCNDGGIYKTDFIQSETWDNINAGNTWPTVWQNLSNGMQITSFYRLSSSKNADDRVIAGAQDNASAYYDGSSWKAIFGGDGMDNYLSTLDPQVVIGSSQYGNFYYSSDGGQFSVFNSPANVNGEEAEWTTPLEGCYVLPNTLYAGFQQVSSSYDEGISWNVDGNLNSTGAPMTALAVSPQTCDVVCALSRVNYFNDYPSRFYYSNDAAGTWTERTSGLPDSLYLSSVAISPLNTSEVVVAVAGFVAGLKVFKSINEGNSWQNISFNLGNFPINMLKYLPNSNTLLAATDAGLFMLPEGQTTWVDQSNGLPNVIVSDIEINENANKIYLSTFGRGIWASDLSFLTTVNTVNPCKDKIEIRQLGSKLFSIEIPNSECNHSFSELEVIDIQGRLIYKTAISGIQTQINLSQVNSGLYFVRLFGSGKSAVQRMFVGE